MSTLTCRRWLPAFVLSLSLPAVGFADAPPLLVQTYSAVTRVDERGAQVVLALPMQGPNAAHEYQPMVVDEATGRWVVSRRARGDGAFPQPRWELVRGDARGVTTLEGDPTCGVAINCFEVPSAFTPDGAAVLTLSMNRRGTTLSRYELATGERRELAGRSIATTLALSPGHDRAAHVSRGGVTLLDWSGRGPSARRASRVAIPGHLERIALTDTTLYYTREVRRAGRTLATMVEALDLATRRRTVVYRPATSLPAWTALEAPARASVFVHDCGDSSRANACDLVELSAAGARVAVRGIAIAYDISADGRHAVAARGQTVVVVDLATGQVIRELPVVGLETAQFTR